MKNKNLCLPLDSLNPQFVVNPEGKKTAVILDINSYEKFLEEVEDLYLGMMALESLAESEYVSHEDVKKKIK